MKHVKIAIVLTTYNGEKYLREQLESLSNQEGVDLDIFVFDDNSTDQTLKIIDEFSETLNIIVSQNAINSGGTGKNILINIRDFGELKILEYDYFALCDQDDIWLNNKLKQAVNLLNKNNASLYCSNLSKWNNEIGIFGTIKKDYPIKKYDYLFEGGSAGCTYVMDSNFISHINKRLKNYPIEGKNRISHDWLLYFLARSESFKVVLDPESRILYRIHENNQYGHLSNFSLKSVKTRLDLLRKDFYQTQIMNNLYFIEPSSIEYKIYERYMRSLPSRIYVLLYYNFNLMRKKSKFLSFFFLSIFFVKTGKLSDLMNKTKKSTKA